MPQDFQTLDQLQLSEPLLSLYRARQFIADPDVLESLDSLILLITKRIIRGKMSISSPEEDSPDG